MWSFHLRIANAGGGQHSLLANSVLVQSWLILPSLSALCRQMDRQDVRWAHRFTQWSAANVTTVLDKELKRQISIDGADYTVLVDPDGLRLTGKGKRKPLVELRWRDLLSGDAALAVALNASLSNKPQPATQRAPEQAAGRAGKPKKAQR